MAAAPSGKIEKNGHISAPVSPIGAIFGTVVSFGSLDSFHP